MPTDSPKISNIADGRKLRAVELNFMKIIEQQNLERVNKLKALRKKNIILGCLIGLGTLSIYGYSMYAVRQETFLDDFEEPKKISAEQ